MLSFQSLNFIVRNKCFINVTELEMLCLPKPIFKNVLIIRGFDNHEMKEMKKLYKLKNLSFLFSQFFFLQEYTKKKKQAYL